MTTTIARWETRGGAHFAILYRDDYGYTYKGRNCGGNLGTLPSDEAAIDLMQARVNTGYFMPDANKLPMKRIAP